MLPPYASLSKERALLGVLNLFFKLTILFCASVCHFWERNFNITTAYFLKNLFYFHSSSIKIFQCSHYFQCLTIKGKDNKIKQWKKEPKESPVMIFVEINLPCSIFICPQRSSPNGNLSSTIICVLPEDFKCCFPNASTEMSLSLY